MADKEIEANLIFIKANYGIIPSSITPRIEASGIPLTEAIGIVNNAKTSILNNTNTSNQGKAIKKKFENVLEKNGYTAMETIANILEGKETFRTKISEELTYKRYICHMAFVSITSVDVERSFSTYKNILSDNRRSLVFEQINNILLFNAMFKI